MWLKESIQLQSAFLGNVHAMYSCWYWSQSPETAEGKTDQKYNARTETASTQDKIENLALGLQVTS